MKNWLTHGLILCECSKATKITVLELLQWATSTQIVQGPTSSQLMMTQKQENLMWHTSIKLYSCCVLMPLLTDTQLSRTKIIFLLHNTGLIHSDWHRIWEKMWDPTASFNQILFYKINLNIVMLWSFVCTCAMSRTRCGMKRNHHETSLIWRKLPAKILLFTFYFVFRWHCRLWRFIFLYFLKNGYWKCRTWR